ncbi:hypothetical protein EW145_g641 [Phellinidium pouzarii]|uniref:Uncharacterized protein n=1 Tax=Phellinidium pouzarii TaxID=167371 RepID=A0A4S4LHK3_9AGAM|nr:hypothetical protein EW145_g641 [Phellinidium pouzarii]
MPKRQFVHGSHDEVIEDSEPEREEAQKRLKRDRQRQREMKKAKNLKVIEITDSDSNGNVASYIVQNTGLANGSPMPNAHAFDDVRASSTITSETGSLFSDVAVARVIADEAYNSAPANNIHLVPATHEESTDDEFDECTSKMRTKLSQFTFSQGSSVGNRVSRVPSIPIEIDMVKLSTAKAKKAKQNINAYLDFTEQQLKCLRKCISCDIKWTTRKTVAQKISHIEKCAKTGRLSNETMRILISREVESKSQLSKAQASAKAKKRQPSVQPAEERPPKTFLEDVLEEGEGQRIYRHQTRVIKSVKSVGETRNNILERAKLLFAQPSTSPVGWGDDGSVYPFIATQAFGASNLESRSTRHLSPERDDAEPPLTQVFAKSSLASSLMRPHSGLALESALCSRESSDVLPFSQTLAVLNPALNPDPSALRLSNESQYTTKFSKSCSTVEASADSTLQINLSPKRLRDDGLTEDDFISDEAIMINDESKSALMVQNQRRKMISDMELLFKLKIMILKDEKLYLKISRYEPIHFGVFMEMTGRLSIITCESSGSTD